MIKLKYLILVLIVALFSSCDKVDEIGMNESDYLIFGHFYGECIGEECVETYKLTNEKLFEDLNDKYSGREPFHFVELKNGEFDEVKDLINFFPSELLIVDESTFGCPDCADQGGLYVEYKKEGVLRIWRIDQSKNEVPTYLHDFIDKINAKIGLINN